jgi:hypothetical protein
MNKVRLSLSIFGLCGFLSTTGLAGEFVSNNSLCCLSKKATPNNTSTTPTSQPTQDSQPTYQPTQDSQPIVIITPAATPTGTCGHKTIITDSNGQVTTIETTCKQRSTNY